MSKQQCDLVRRYGGAFVVVALAVALRAALDSVLQDSGFAIFLTGMLLAAWVGGLGPCLLAQTALLTAEVLYFRTGPSPPTTAFQGAISLIAFYSVGGIVGLLSESRSAIRTRVREQQKEMLDQREQLRAMFSCMADGVIVTDIEGRISLMNPTAETISGWNLLECRGKQLNEVLPLYDESRGMAVVDPLDLIVEHRYPVNESVDQVLATRSGSLLPVAYSAAPLFDVRGEPAGVVLLISDQTERRQILNELRNANRQKDEFLATLAHELRNPLAPICMGVELLKMSTDDPGTTSEVLSTVERQAQHMVRLIDDLLDISRITRGKVELRRSQVTLSEVVQNAVDATRPLVAQAGHQLEVDLPTSPILLDVDPSRFTQILSNLLNNAAKYTPEGGRVGLSAKQADGNLVITVSDNGVGIPEDKLESIFEMFMQDRESMENGHKGLGIGLTLVKRLTEMHGGTIDVESEGRGTGSRFHVSLPTPALKTPVGDSSPIAPVAHTVSGVGRVLVVDDNEDSLVTLSQIVRKLGNEVRQARNGLEAVDMAHSFEPHVVLMDIGMPKLNGLEAAKQIREQPWGNGMALVATTGWGQAEDRQRTKDAGFDHHLVKPVDHRDLLRLLAELLPTESHPATVPNELAAVNVASATSGGTKKTLNTQILSV